MMPIPKVPTLQNLKMRAQALKAARIFFESHGYLEVQTQAMRNTTATDPYIASFTTQWTGATNPLYLQTSPEFPLKILLSHYFVPVVEFAKVFRDEDHGHLHQREFLLIEWYKPYADYNDLMHETFALIQAVAHSLDKSVLQYQGHTVPLDQGFSRITYREAFERYTSINPFTLGDQALCEAALSLGCRVQAHWPRNDILHAIFLDHIESHLGFDRPTFLCDYPQSMASLARTGTGPDGEAIAERFELYVAGVELCNAYSELIDPSEQRLRFEADNEERKSLQYPTLPIDEPLLSALSQLQPCAGNALGWDRLLMLLCGIDHIESLCITF